MFKKKKEVIDAVTKNAPWYMGDAKGDAVKARIKGEPDGSFVIRNSASEPGKFVLAYSKDGGVKNLHITGTPGKVHLSKSTTTFDCMSDLVKFYHETETDELPLKLIGGTFAVASPEPKKEAKKEKEKKTPKGKDKKEKPEAGGRGAQWKVQDVCDWLESIDLKEYCSTFKKQKVDGSVLLQMDDNDLRELGVGAFGARKKLVQAIQTLNRKFKEMDEGKAPPPGMDGNPAPVSTVGLIARKVDGEVKIFDVDTGQQVFDIAAHQAARQARIAQGLPPPGRGGPPPAAKQTRTFGANDHEMEQWFDKTMPKAKAIDLLSSLDDGEFAVYSSSSNPGCYAFSYVIRGTVAHKLIEPATGGLKFQGSTDVFPNVCALIDNYTKTTGGVLKCSLKYPSQQRNMIAEMPYWNCLDLDKAGALAKIKGQDSGAFVIRPSDKSYAALSLIKPDGSTYHQHIEETSKGLQLKKSSVAHADLNSFVNYYADDAQGDLPCALRTRL